jgi:hypothetical protein
VLLRRSFGVSFFGASVWLFGQSLFRTILAALQNKTMLVHINEYIPNQAPTADRQVCTYTCLDSSSMITLLLIVLILSNKEAVAFQTFPSTTVDRHESLVIETKRNVFPSFTTIHTQSSKRSKEDDFILNRASFLKYNFSIAFFSLFDPKTSVAMYTDTNTRILLPEQGEIESTIPSLWDEKDDPFQNVDKSSFARLDSQPDTIFYQDPRFTEHVDDNAVKLMTNYISSVLHPNDVVLDLCSSWTSHIDKSTLEKVGKISGLGLNEEELQRNQSLHDYIVQDLNASSDLKLPYTDGQFDVVLCQLSIDYMIYPRELLREVGRILKPGGSVHILFSNRLFLQKAVGLWTGKDDLDHAYTVGSYLHYSKGGFVDIYAKDLSTRKKGKIVGDPMYVVVGTKM